MKIMNFFPTILLNILQIFDLNHPKRQIYRKLPFRRKSSKHPAKTRKENERNSNSFSKMLDNMLNELEMTVGKQIKLSHVTHLAHR